MCQGLNSHCFPIIGDKLINPIVGVYIPIIRIPIKGGMTIPNTRTFDHGTYNDPCEIRALVMWGLFHKPSKTLQESGTRWWFQNILHIFTLINWGIIDPI